MRDKTPHAVWHAMHLVEISKAMANINSNGIRIIFDIYTPTELDKSTTEILNQNGCTLHAPVAKDQVRAIQRDADIVVFVESLDKKHRFDARLSFSTKLTDYFASGKCIFAIGDKAIAPIKYLETYNCAVTCTDYSQVEQKLRDLVNHPEAIVDYGRRAFEIGRENHEESKVRETFIKTICRASKKQ